MERLLIICCISHLFIVWHFPLAERLSPDKPREVKIDIEDGVSEDRRRRRAHSPGGLDKRRSMASRSTTEATTITDQEDAQSVTPLCTMFGVVTLPRVKLLASIGGLVLETEVREMSVSLSRQEETGKECEGLRLFLLILFLFCAKFHNLVPEAASAVVIQLRRFIFLKEMF